MVGGCCRGEGVAVKQGISIAVVVVRWWWCVCVGGGGLTPHQQGRGVGTLDTWTYGECVYILRNLCVWGVCVGGGGVL
jgi:hypothetical protein